MSQEFNPARYARQTDLEKLGRLITGRRYEDGPFLPFADDIEKRSAAYTTAALLEAGLLPLLTEEDRKGRELPTPFPTDSAEIKLAKRNYEAVLLSGTVTEEQQLIAISTTLFAAALLQVQGYRARASSIVTWVEKNFSDKLDAAAFHTPEMTNKRAALFIWDEEFLRLHKEFSPEPPKASRRNPRNDNAGSNSTPNSWTLPNDGGDYSNDRYVTRSSDHEAAHNTTSNSPFHNHFAQETSINQPETIPNQQATINIKSAFSEAAKHLTRREKTSTFDTQPTASVTYAQAACKSPKEEEKPIFDPDRRRLRREFRLEIAKRDPSFKEKAEKLNRKEELFEKIDAFLQKLGVTPPRNPTSHKRNARGWDL